ncbi:hypothetical protein ATO6_17455 [Oceanicola sp. 22II-s10i]|uniref:hypothetical protein n=1 Tax=Oceanicola sp. 22II-s10i TaxID=1317116 RepID=UPI000B520CF0|nr:hypothetical protein [Oceanicola sp. 22II-s10i]OWU83648.1 hypothetical protein ATO6_17455 [Oceanicola sp. 22II-s10i]
MTLATRITLALSLALVSGGAQALTPLPPCEIEEGGMRVSGASFFGYSESGFILEQYRNLDTADGIIGGAPGPIPALNNFNGVRITDCRSGGMVAIDGISWEADATLNATEFLRHKAQARKRFELAEVEQAARAVYGKSHGVRILRLRETEETCACNDHYPGLWQGR